MAEPRPVASLTAGLLARKGTARPAMRPQLHSFGFDESPRLPPVHNDAFSPEDDLGWNDMGEDSAPAEIPGGVVAITPHTPVADEAPQPEVLRQIDSLVDVITRKAAMDARVAAAEAQAMPRPSRRKGEALKEGRKAAFTLRLNAERHLRLRIAAAIESRSAQAVVAEALDHFLNAIPGMDDLARRARDQ